MYPEDLLYTREHEWIRVEGETAVLGITEFAQAELGDIVYVELPSVGDEFEAGDEIGTIESVKAVAELFTPVSGEIVRANDGVVGEPETINDDPHGEGWLVEIEISEESREEELGELMDRESYERFLEGNS